MPTAEIPDKLYYKIGEVAAIARLRPSVLRFWETEFPGLQPTKSKTGQRLYSRKDLETVLELKQLLHGEKLTIAGARKRLARRQKVATGEGSEPEPTASDELRKVIADLREELRKIRDSL